MLKKLLGIIGSIATLFATLIAIGIGGDIGKIAGKAAFSSSKPSPQEVEARLIEGFTQAVNQYKPMFPMMLDKETRLDNATVGPGPRLVYHYTFIDYTSGNIDANTLSSNFRAGVTRKVCASSNMKKPLQYGGIYVYAYSGNDGIEVGRIEIDRNDCGFSKLSF